MLVPEANREYHSIHATAFLFSITIASDYTIWQRSTFSRGSMTRKEIEDMQKILRLRQIYPKDIFARVYKELISYERGSDEQTAYMMQRMDTVVNVYGVCRFRLFSSSRWTYVLIYQFTMNMNDWGRLDFLRIKQIQTEVEDLWHNS